MAGQGMRAGCKQRAFDTGNIGDGLLHTLLVWTAQRVAHMRNRMPLHFELHADKQQRKHEHGRSQYGRRWPYETGRTLMARSILHT